MSYVFFLKHRMDRNCNRAEHLNSKISNHPFAPILAKDCHCVPSARSQTKKTLGKSQGLFVKFSVCYKAIFALLYLSQCLSVFFAFKIFENEIRYCHDPCITDSIRRQAYPHSLSYHDRIFTKSPSTTFVNGRSMMPEYEVFKMSLDTIGSSETPMMPL